jgi:hypothetical protein
MLTDKERSMKKILLSFILLPFSFLFAQNTIIDSVYSDPYLDGYIQFRQNYQSCQVNNWMYDMAAGDTDVNPYIQDPNSYFRSFISFELPELPENYYVDSCYVRLYQYSSCGQCMPNQFPEWNVAGGDTMKCILSHIDYGAELDAGDFDKGDVGNPYTFTNNVGTVSEDWQEGYRYIDVTSCVAKDYDNERQRSQYRIAFQIDTDWDNLADQLGFITSSGLPPHPEYHPTLYILFSDTPVSTNIEMIKSPINLQNFPNPFNPTTEIRLQVSDFRQIENPQIEIYNLKGQKVKRVAFPNWSFGTREGSVSWDGSDENGNQVSSGIYLYKLNMGNSPMKKMLLLK